MTYTPTWLSGIIAKRTDDAIRIVTDCIHAGLMRGECSALDVRDVHFDEPNIIGATMRGCLPALGFVHTERRVKSEIKRKHARRVDVWELQERWKAESFLDHERVKLIGMAAESNQMRLAI